MAPPSNPPPRRRPSTGMTSAKPPVRRTGVAAAAGRGGAKLVVVSGPANGQEYPLDGEELVLGRSAENQVSIPDTSVSRKHAMMRKVDNGWAISDLGSGNGTLLNGEAIAEETKLKNDDVIAMGDSELKFVEPKRATSVRPAVRGGTGVAPRVRTSRMEEDPAVVAARKKRMVIVAVSLGAIVLTVGGVMFVKEQKRARIEAAARAGEEKRLAEISAQIQDAKALVSSGKWQEAMTKFQDAQISLAEQPFQFPENEALHKEYEDTCRIYLNRGDQGLSTEKALAEARAKLASKEPGAATVMLKKININIVSKDLETAKADAKKLTTEATAAARQLQGETKDLDKMTELSRIVEDLLLASPDNRELQQLKSVADAAINAIKNPKVYVPTAANPASAVRAKYREGDSSAAKMMAEQCAPKNAECKKLVEQIQDVQGKFSGVEGMQLKDLRVTYKLDTDISGGESTMSAKPLRTRLVTQLYVEAAKFKTSEQWVKAVTLCREAIAVEPSHAGCSSLLKDAELQCQTVYLRGYQLQQTDPDESVKFYKQVLEMCPADNEYRRKGEARLKELGR